MTICWTCSHDGGQAGRESRFDLQIDRLVGFAQDMTSLAVPEDHVLAAEVQQHAAADFARERPLRFVVHVLCAQSHCRPLDGLTNGVQVKTRGANGQIHVGS